MRIAHAPCLTGHGASFSAFAKSPANGGYATIYVSMDVRDCNFTCACSDAIQEPNRGQVNREVVAPSLELPSPRRLCLKFPYNTEQTRLVIEKRTALSVFGRDARSEAAANAAASRWQRRTSTTRAKPWAVGWGNERSTGTSIKRTAFFFEGVFAHRRPS